MMYKLINTVKNFDWGSTTALNELFEIPNEENIPQAELWMGAHPNGCSKVVVSDGSVVKLSEFIARDSLRILGKAGIYDELPFLMKVLAAQSPLSIQVHPNKFAAENGFERESIAGIPLNSAERNYKDPNHKPELVYAITPYLAMNGFRTPNVIFKLLSKLEVPVLSTLLENLNNCESESAALNAFFVGLLSLENEEKEAAIGGLKYAMNQNWDDEELQEVLSLSRELFELYPQDIGIYSPFFLNIIELQPGEAMFLHAETPHAYIRGVGVEVMANSDNVLRAGLTPKHIDIPELVSNTKFCATLEADIKITAIQEGVSLHYPVPVSDFSFSILNIESTVIMSVSSAEILLCLEGKVTMKGGELEMTLRKGESVFVSCEMHQYQLFGMATIVRANF